MVITAGPIDRTNAMTPLQKSNADPVLNLTIRTHDMSAQTNPAKAAKGRVKNAIRPPYPANDNSRSDRSAVIENMAKLAL